MGFNVNDLKKSKFLKRTDVTRPVLVTISGSEEVNVAQEGVEPEMKWALTFDELDKPMVLNSTNGQIIASIVGSGDSEDWIGHKVVLYDDPNVSFGGKLVGGIRIRAPRNQQPALKPPVDMSDAAKAARAEKLRKVMSKPPVAPQDPNEEIPVYEPATEEPF